MKKYVWVLAAIMFGILATPMESVASPHAHKCKKHHHNAVAHHQHDKIHAMKSIAKADGRISPRERAVIKHERYKMADKRHLHPKHHNGVYYARR